MEEGELTLLGLAAMLDPPRPEAMAAVARCQAAGIAVKMITGDHVATARAIAGRLQLGDRRGTRWGGPRCMSGAELAALPEGGLADAIERASVFARVAPEQKLRLVEALQARGHVVAMTGDGVNDAPALTQADIGVAMGVAGTEVAREAADVVLTDDNFASIAAAVEEGRRVFDNLTKFIVWTLPTNMGEGLLILVAILAGTTLPILPVQILWINMTTAGRPGADAGLRAEGAGPHGPAAPRPGAPDPHRRADRADPARVGAADGGLVRALPLGAGRRRSRWPEARTAAINVFVVGELFYLFNCRSLEHSMFRVGALSNHWVTGGVADDGGPADPDHLRPVHARPVPHRSP